MLSLTDSFVYAQIVSCSALFLCPSSFVFDFPHPPFFFIELGPFLKDVFFFILLKKFVKKTKTKKPIFGIPMTFDPHKLFCPAGNPVNPAKPELKRQH